MLEISGLGKRFPNGHLVLSGIDLAVAPGEIFGIVGGSGCGKSTLLRLVAGLDTATTGSVAIDGETIRAPHAAVGLVFQEPRLMPWLTIEDNIGFGIHHLAIDERRDRVRLTLARVGLAAYAHYWPRQLSGGMAQRAALARALVGRPQVLLLDEPFSALDALTRTDLQEHLLDLWAYDRPTLVLVTHDIEEALALSDRIAIMEPEPGRIRLIVRPPLARPRDRTSLEFQEWKQRLLGELQISWSGARQGDENFPAAAI